jgi:predicted DNA-binding protein with PD1-like motif
MKTFKTSTGYVVRLDPGEEILGTLTGFVIDEEIAGGTITGIGAVKNTTIGYFDLHRKEYSKRRFSDDMELVNLTGNVTWVEGEPFVHAHATISGPDFVAHSGHLFEAEIAVTGEFLLHPTDRRILRAPDERTGLKLIDG